MSCPTGCGLDARLPDVVKGAVWAVTWTTVPPPDLSGYAGSTVVVLDSLVDGSRVHPAVEPSADSSYLTISLTDVETAALDPGSYVLSLFLGGRAADRASVRVVAPSGGPV